MPLNVIIMWEKGSLMFPHSEWEMDNKRKASVGMPYVAFPDVVGVFVYVSGQAEVTDLHDVALRQENVPRCQVSVDTLWIHTHGHTYIRTQPTGVCACVCVFVDCLHAALSPCFPLMCE